MEVVFPREVLEKIFMHCDGKTLKQVQRISPEYRNIVHYLAEKENIWKKCCHEEIPEDELSEYQTKWCESPNETDCVFWRHLYNNWLKWQDIKVGLEFRIEPAFRLKHKRISCMKVMDNVIALGLKDGSVKVVDSQGWAISTHRYFSLPVLSIHIISDATTNLPTELLIVYPNFGCIAAFDTSFEHCTFPNCNILSTFRQFFCGVTRDCQVVIAEIGTNVDSKRKTYEIIASARVYAFDRVRSCKLFKDRCLLLVCDKIKVIKYKSDAKCSHCDVLDVAIIDFSIADSFSVKRDVTILNEKVIVSITTHGDAMEQLFELFVRNDCTELASKKIFVPWTIFYAYITCVYLYGNTFVVGTSKGSLYFYSVRDWKLFSLVNYYERVTHTENTPVVSVDAIERSNMRLFYVASPACIYKVIGKTEDEEEDCDEEEISFNGVHNASDF